MKIYFEDGFLVNTRLLPEKPDYTLNASTGVTFCRNILDNFKEANEPVVIYTNSIMAFSNKYAWNGEMKVPEIYIRSGEHMLFTRIDVLTNRELREAHNLAKMYIAGEFNCEV